jgi:hypothetical protein
VSSALSSIPIHKRRQFAGTLGLFAVLFVAVGIVATTGTTPGVVRVFSAVSLTVATLLALASWGMLHSIKIDLAEQRLDAAIDAVVGSTAGANLTCGCGHDHDPDEMHVTGESCAHDGTGADCTHTCSTCVLASLRPSPTKSRSARLAE